jgi:hypothetical protein
LLGLGMLSGKLGGMENKLVGIEDNLLCRLFDVEINLQSSLVGPVTQKLQIIERQVVIEWSCPVYKVSRELQTRQPGGLTYVSGRMSRSVAILKVCEALELKDNTEVR